MFYFLFSRDGNLQDIIDRGSLHEFLVGLHDEYGSVASFWFGGRPVVSLGSVSELQQHINPNHASKQTSLDQQLFLHSGICWEKYLIEKKNILMHKSAVSCFLFSRLLWNDAEVAARLQVRDGRWGQRVHHEKKSVRKCHQQHAEKQLPACAQGFQSQEIIFLK